MDQSGHSTIVHEPDPEFPGWWTWDVADKTRFNPHALGRLIVRKESDDAVRLRLFTARQHANLHDRVHGGVTLSLIDVALFVTSRILRGVNAAGSVTLDLSTQFISPGAIGEPLDAVTEVLRETGRLVFLRGKVEQDGNLIAAYSGAIRKPSRR